jgi:hypothetical protein
MYQYKDHPIYGIGNRGPEKKWYGRGLIFDAEDKVTEIKRLESAELTFATKKKAEEHAVKLCKEWIDEQSSGIDSSGLTHSAPLKAGAISLLSPKRRISGAKKKVMGPICWIRSLSRFPARARSANSSPKCFTAVSASFHFHNADPLLSR